MAIQESHILPGGGLGKVTMPEPGTPDGRVAHFLRPFAFTGRLTHAAVTGRFDDVPLVNGTRSKPPARSDG